MTDLTESKWRVRWEGGDGWHTMSLLDLEDQLHDEARDLVDMSEQEILEGGHFDTAPNGEEIRSAEIQDLRDDVQSQLERAVWDGGGEIKFHPWYAVNQREAYRVWIRPQSTEEQS